ACAVGHEQRTPDGRGWPEMRQPSRRCHCSAARSDAGMPSPGRESTGKSTLPPLCKIATVGSCYWADVVKCVIGNDLSELIYPPRGLWGIGAKAAPLFLTEQWTVPGRFLVKSVRIDRILAVSVFGLALVLSAQIASAQTTEKQTQA